MRKRLRAAGKLADVCPQYLLKHGFRPLIIAALCKEFKGTLDVCLSKASSLEADQRLEQIFHNGSSPLESRPIIDIKLSTGGRLIIKSRWAPGGHKQEKPTERSELAAPTLITSQLLLLTHAGNELTRFTPEELKELEGHFRKTLSKEEYQKRFPKGFTIDFPRAFN